MKIGKPRAHDHDRVIQACDGKKTSRMIAEELGLNPKFVQKLMKRYNLPRLARGGPEGNMNGSWKGGSTIDQDGYRLVIAPKGHPHARKSGYILEHRLVMESVLGRYLEPLEVVDHIDGCTLNNNPENLRLFESNAAHLAQTLAGKTPQWSDEGLAKLKKAPHATQTPVDSHDQKRKSGALRCNKILRAREQLGKDDHVPSDMQRLLERKKRG
jgi:hypothetical protein